MKNKNPCDIGCSKCGSFSITRRYRRQGEKIGLNFRERDNKCISNEFLKGDWPYGWIVKKEHINNFCQTCEYEFITNTL